MSYYFEEINGEIFLTFGKYKGEALNEIEEELKLRGVNINEL